MAKVEKPQSMRDRLRSKIFSGRATKKKIIKMFGQDVEIRQSSVGRILDLRDETDTRKQLVKAMVSYCYVPGTNDRVFEDQDEEAIMELPLDTWFEELNNAVAELTSVNIVDAEKNLSTTPGDNTS